MLNRKHTSAALSQLWYEDDAGIIRSKLNGYMIDLTGLTTHSFPFQTSHFLTQSDSKRPPEL